jgi:hypothetical protein
LDSLSQEMIYRGAPAVFKQKQREEWHAVALGTFVAARARDVYATTPSLGCGVLIASKKQHLAEMPPAIDTAWVLGEVVLK